MGRNDTPRSIRAAVDEACSTLTPVVVDLGEGQPKLASFMHSVEGRGRAACLVLSPIAAEALPAEPRRIVVRTCVEEGPALALHARRAERADDGSIRVPLDGATLRTLRPRARRRTVVSARDPMMLMVSAGVDGSDVHGFPILDLCDDACAIEAGAPPPVGASFDPIEIVRDRAVVRVGSAVVEEVIPWRASNGAKRFRCRLRIGESKKDRSDSVYDLVSDPERVRRVLDLAGTAALGVWIEAAGKRQAATSLDVGADTMTVGVSEPAAATRIRLGFELFAVSYELEARLIEHRRNRLVLALPLYLRKRVRRQERRVEIPRGREIAVEYRNPITERRERRPLVDISHGGLCFEIDEDTGVAWSGLALEDARLHDGDRVVELGGIEVRSIDRAAHPALCHAALRDGKRAHDSDLSDLIASLKYPDLRAHDGDDFRGMLATYRREHVLYDYMTQNLEPVAPVAASNWRRLHQNGHEIVRTLLHEEGSGEPDATVTAVRAWEQGWVIQHFGAVKGPDQFRWSGELQRAIVEHVMLRPEGRFLFFFVNQKNASMNAFYERFFEATGTSEAIEHGTMDFWALPPGRALRPAFEPSSVIRPMRAADEPVVSRAAERALGPRSAAALSFVPGGMRLPAVEKAFRTAGLERGRTARIVSRGGRPELALFGESMSAGVNLAWMLSAHWLLPIHGASQDPNDPAVHAALAAMEDAPAPSPYGERFLLTPGSCFEGALEARGWEKRIATRTYVMNRTGLQRYFLYVADRYGAAEAKAMKRRMKEKTG